MVTQSRAEPVPLLLTRPEVQGADLLRDLDARFGPQFRIIRTPLLAPRFYAPVLPDGPFAALILTSQTGVEGYLRLGAQSDVLPRKVFCVGARTASAARAAQLHPLVVTEDAASLIQQIIAMKPAGTLLHLRGRETRGNIRFLLDSSGIDTAEAIIYAQDQQVLTAEAVVALHAAAPVIAPLFSPRTATILAGEVARIGGISPLFVAAMSGEVALEAGAFATQIKIAVRPDAAAMLDVLAMLLVEMKRA